MQILEHHPYRRSAGCAVQLDHAAARDGRFGYRDMAVVPSSSTPSSSPSCSASCSGFPTAIRKKELQVQGRLPHRGAVLGGAGERGCRPLHHQRHADMSVSEAFFESFLRPDHHGGNGADRAGQSAQGVSLLPPAAAMARWHGIIVLAVAVLPLLGIGACSSIAPRSGARQDNKVTPRIAETAKALWFIYLLLTSSAPRVLDGGDDAVRCHLPLLLHLVGGGFSTHDASIGFFAARPST